MTSQTTTLPAPDVPTSVPSSPESASASEQWGGGLKGFLHRPGFLGALLGLFAVLLRSIQLSRAYDVFVDEVTYLDIGRAVQRVGLPSLHGEPFFLHPPGFFVLEALWGALFGGGGDLFAQLATMRVLNVVLAGVTAGLLFHLGRRVGGKWAGVFAAGMFAVDPWIIRQNSRVMLETSTLMWVLLGYSALLGLMRVPHRRPRWAALSAGLAFGLAIVTKDFAVLMTLVPLGVCFVLGWALPRRLIVVTVAAAAIPYTLYVATVVAAGEFGALWEQKALGVQRTTGEVQMSGYNKDGAPSLAGAIMENVAPFWTTYLIVALGLVALAVLLRSRRGDHRLMGTFLGAGFALMAYASRFGTIEEQFLYFLVIPALLGVATAGRLLLLRARAGARGRWVTGAAVGALGVMVASCGVTWYHVHTTPDDATRRMARWMRANVDPDTPIALTSNVQQMVLKGYNKLSSLDPVFLLEHKVRYLVVFSKQTTQGYAFSTEEEVERLDSSLKRVFSHKGRSNGEVAVFELDPAAILAKVDLSKVDLSKIDLSKIDLSKIDLSKVDLSKVDLSKVDLSKLDPSKLPPGVVPPAAPAAPAAAPAAAADPAAPADPSTIDPSTIDPSTIDPSTIDPSKIDLSKIDPSKIDPSKIDTSKIDLSKIDPSKLPPSLRP